MTLDFNTPETTSSGFLDGMALSILTGRCWKKMAETIDGFQAVPDSAVMLLGSRDLDEAEETALAQSGIVRLSASAAHARLMPLLQSMAPALEGFYLHLDLDVLGSAGGRANSYAIPGGFMRDDLTALLSRIAKDVHVRALTVSAFDPSCDQTGRVKDSAFAAIASVLQARN
jgi:arginase